MRHPSTDDTPIREAERLFRWPLAGVRAHPGLSDLDLGL